MIFVLLCAPISFMLPTSADAAAGGFFFMDKPRLGFELSYELDAEKRKGLFINRKDEKHKFTEGLEIETKGWFYNPALLVYKLRLMPKWENTREHDNSGRKKESASSLLGYSVNLVFLQFKPYMLTLFADKKDSTLRSNFASATITEKDRYGAQLNLKYNLLPTKLMYTHTESRQTGFYNSEIETDDSQLNMAFDKYLGITTLVASYMDSAQVTSNRPSNVRQLQANLQNKYFTQRKKVSLGTYLNYYDTQANATEGERYSFSENLYWNHSKSLRIGYKFRYDIYERHDSNTMTLFRAATTSFGFDLTHLLYENLTTTIVADSSRRKFTEGRDAAYNTGIRLDYRRRIPWGALQLNTSHNYNLLDRRSVQIDVQILNEALILKTGDVSLLKNKNVDINSITVTDTTGGIVYIRDIDYTVTEVGSFVRIERTAFGAISDGQQALASYRYTSNPVFDYYIYRQSYGIVLDLWSALSLGYTYSHAQQYFISGVRPDELSEDATNSVRAELKLKWSQTRVTYTDIASTTGVSMRSWLSEEDLTFMPDRDLYIKLSGHYGKTLFKEDNSKEKLTGLQLHVLWAFERLMRLEIRGFQNRISSEKEKTLNTGASSSLELHYRLYVGAVSYIFLKEKKYSNGETTDKHYLLLKVKRELW